MRGLASDAEADIVLEPVGRNTAPAIALAALLALGEAGAHEDPLLLVLAADHVIRDAAEFRAAVSRAVPVAAGGHLVTFGIVPQGPETGYGYIRRAPQPLEGFSAAYPIRRFVEKPDRTTAEGFVAAGDYLWNSGMFLFSARPLSRGTRAPRARYRPRLARGVRGREARCRFRANRHPSF
jgi:mannose-1-phosphate guanylyltransferase